MGFNDEYMKLRKKRLGEAEKEADKKTENKTFTDTYNELRNERLATTPKDNRSDLLTMKARSVMGGNYDDDAWKSALAELQTKGDAWHEEMAAKRKKAEEEDRSWFEAGAFEDGYDFGDITKTILGTGTELVDSALTGIAGMGEAVVDAGAYVAGGVGGLFGADEFQEDMQEFIADDLYDESAVGEAVGYLNPLKWGNELLNGGDADANSILGEKAEGLTESAGQLLATAGLQMVGVPWWLTTGATSFGGEVENAFNQGATYGEAGLSAAISAGAEVLTEKLSGGISFGGKTLDDVLLDPLTQKISSKLARSLVNVGLDAVGEGAEEVISSVASKFGQALYKEESLGELLTSEEAFDEYLESFIGGAVLGGGMGGVNAFRSGKQGRDYKTGLTDNEQKVFDKVLENEIAKAEEGGKTLTSKEKAEIEKQVKRDLEKGFISTDTIEEVLGEDTYKAYKDAVANEDAIKKEYADLGSKEYLDPAEYERYVELGKLIEETDSKQLKAEADKSFAELLKKDTYLQNSYNERVRRSQKFEADLSQYKDENAKKTVENAIKYGMHNGTDAHEFVDFAAKIAAKKGYVVDFTNTRMLKESVKNGNEYGIEADPENVQAFVSESKKTIVVNMNAKKSLNSLVGHEVTHTLEDSGAYDQLQKYIFEYARSKNEYASRYKDIESRYSKVTADVQKELTADLCGDYLLTDYDFISQLATKDRNVFQKVYDEIKYLFKLATTGSKEARALEKAKHYYEKALRESTKAQGGTKYSLDMVDAVKPTSGKWTQGATTDEVRAAHPTLYAVDETATEERNPTQVKGTIGSYRKVYESLKSEGFNGTILDASSGLGYGTKAGIEEYGFNVEDIEPYPDSGYKPKYTDYSSLDKTYDVVISNAVLNVLPQDQRDALVVKMGELLNPGGRMFVNVRGRDVLNASGKIAINEANMEYFIPRTAKTGSYQKGFSKGELVAYLEDALGEDFTVKPTNMFGAVSAIVTKDGGVKYSLSDSEGDNLDAIKAKYREKTDYLFMHEKNDTISIDNMVVKKEYRNQGIGTQILNDVIAYADETGKTITLTPTSEFGTKARLTKWYKANGFVENKGRNADYRMSDTMYRLPQSTKYSLSDSDGKKLTKEQSEYFKDSKMRDENGNLKVMYHGSQDAGFHVFDSRMSDDDTSFFFVDRNDVAASYSGTTETYEAQTIRTAEDMNNFLAGVNAEGYEVVEQGDQFILLYEGDRVAASDTAQGIYEEYCWYEGVGEGDANYKVYLNLTNPLEIDAKGRPWNKIDAEFSQEVYDKYNSLTDGERAALIDLAEWEDFRLFNSEIQEASGNELASAYAKMGEDVNIYDLFSVAADNFSEESMRENSRRYLKTRDFAQRAKEQGYDGVIFKNLIDNGGYSNGDEGASTVAIAFNSEQIKSVANATPTSDPDIRFSLSKSVEETKDLMALHNLKAGELLKSLDLGGLPMPSIAVIKAEAGHEQYGDVSLIIPKDAIDPKKDKANKVYGGDAWTPTYPRIEYKPSASVEKKISDKYYELAHKIGYDDVRPLYRYVHELEDVLNRSGGEAGMLNEIYNDTGIMQVFLADSGKGKVETIQKETRTEMSDAEVEMKEYFINALGADVIDSVMTPSGASPMAHRTEYWKEHGEAIKKTWHNYFTEKHGFTAEEADNVLSAMKTYDFLKFVRDTHVYRKNGRVTTKTEPDISATNEAIKAAASDGYKEWVDGLFKGVEEKTGIRNNAGYFTNSGNRRSWDALHWENTLENVVRVMKQQKQTGADAIFGASQLFAVSAKDYRSIADVKADSDRLYKMSEDEYEAVKESYMQRMSDISNRIMDKGERNQFIALDNAMECIVDAVRSSKTAEGIYRNLQQYSQLTVTEQDAADIAKLVNDIANMPTGYFEAKPQRAVGFDEVGVFVIPRNADAALKQELLNRGYSIAEYDPDVEGDRQKVVNSFEEYKFSLARGTEKTYGNYNVYGKDLELAPTAEAQEDVAPVAKDWHDVVNTMRDPELDEDGDWTQEYADYHKGIQQQLSFDMAGEVVADVDNGLTSEELKAKSEAALREYEEIQAKKTQGEAYTEKEMLTLHALYSRYSFYDSVANDPTYVEKLRYSLSEDTDIDPQERLESLTEDDMPPETIAPYVPEKEPITVDEKSLGTITQKANEILALDSKDSARLADIIRDYARDESFTERDLHEAIRDNFRYTEEMENDADEISQAKQHMRGVTLYIDPDYKGDFHGKNKDGYNAFRREHFGHFHLTTKPTSFALSVDSFYEELSDLYPTLFPADIGNAADRLQRMGEVADMKPETVSRSMEYDDDVIQEVVGIINNELTQYSQGETLRLLDESASAFYKSVEAKDIAPSVEYIDEDGQLTMAPDEASQQDPAKKEIQRINNRLEQERARLRTELQQKKAKAQAIADNKDAFISNKASELYEELRNLKKGVRASKDLGALLDFGYEWSAVKAALTNIRYSPDKRVNQNSVIESIAREMLNSHYEDAVYSLDELEFEYQDKIAKLEAGAESQRQQARAATASEATAETAESKPRTRKDLHQEKIDGISAAFADKGYNFKSVLKNAKNLSTWSTVDNTPQRVMEKALGYEAGQILADETVNKVAQNESEGVKWLNSITDRKNGLLAKLSARYDIKPGSKESAAAQMLGEGFYVNDKGEYVKYGVEELEKDFHDANVRANIIGLAGDQRIRQFYDDTLQAINESRARNLYPEIPRLENYFLHFRAMEDTFSRLGLPFNPNDIRAKDLPTDLNGVTADLKPGQPYFASAMHRRGHKTTYDILGGIEKYATSAKNQIYHIDDIQTLRALRNYIAETYGQAKGLEGLDLLTETEAEERIKDVFDAHLSTFAKFLNEEANVLAGKTALIDRGIEGIIGRRGMMFVDTVNKQVGSNMVGYNVSSSLTNLLAGVQAIAKTNKASAVKAFAQTTASKFGSLFGNTNSFAENDPFLIRRKGAERFHRTPFQKIGDAGYFLASAVDNVTSEFVVRAKYNEFIKKGMGQQQAIEEADKWAARLMGDRSLGQMPHLYNSKMLGLVTKFQLEVRNQLDSQFYDTVQEAKASNKDIQSGLERNSKIAAKVTKTLFELAVLQHVFGKAFEAVSGYNPAFDIIGVLATAFGFDDEEDSEDTVLDNVEQGFLELLEDLPYTSTFTGGRIPISSALPIEELVTGQDEYGNEKSRLETLAEIAPYYILPGGYGQLKKTAQGLSMFDDDLPVPGSYTDSGSLRFPVEDTFGSRLQAGIFGQWASENARDYFNNGRKPLNEKQTQEYIDSEMSIDEYWEYREGLSGLSTLAEKADYIYDLDIPTWKKNLLINNIADRKEDIDMSDYGNYDSFAEFDYAMKNPEKYNFLTENGISYQEYVGADEDTKEAYNWAYKNPEEYRMWKAVGDDVTAFRQYAKDIYDLEADKDEEGKSIRGSRKEKVIDYVSNLDVDYGVKCILFKSEYPADDTYNADILDYLNSREDLTYDDIKTILSELGFTVYDDGTVEW